MNIIDRMIENIVRNYICKKMHQRRLVDLFKMIQEEYTYVYHEDNYFDRKSLLHDLVDETMPEHYKNLVKSQNNSN